MAARKTAPTRAPTRARRPARAGSPKGLIHIKAAAYVVKSEPSVYSFDQLVADEKSGWEGVRNFEARNMLRAMKKGDTLLYYHSNEGKEIVGIARVVKEAFQDPTTEEDWSSIELAPVKRLAKPVGLAELKVHPFLKNTALVARSRISVTPVTAKELAEILRLGETKI